MSASSNAGRIGVWGRSGSGKSSYAKARLKSARRVVVFDPLGEYGAEGFKVVDHQRDGLDAVRLKMIEDWRGFRIAYQPPSGREVAALSALSRLLIAAQAPYKDTGRGAGLTLVVEEMNLSFPVAGGAQKCAGFAEICSRGRHYGIEVIGISQRIAEVATRFRGNCTETVVFPQKGKRDLDAAAAELGVHPDQVRELKNLHYLHEQAGEVTSGAVVAKRKAANTNAAPAKRKRRA
ncbi:hypothetical protein [Thioclava nitratireducens]|uniref:hypothetical protein n=1 Tax=Thioclava nitratireducens TaxID=1915078 RepID=UPI002481656A|nr:hypothetical protein [Thioclava nitratireducens]WGT50157.1 hypothetical protein P0N61_17925 [Thioclava nitratireducens]